MIAVTYRITLEQPLLATSLEGEPNSAISFGYIPGSLIRGALAGRVASNGGQVDLATEERALIFNGDVRYLNAYPVLAGESTRRLPTPLSWKVKKEEAGQEGAKVWDFALLSREDRRKIRQTNDLSGYAVLEDGAMTRYRPERQITVHTLRDRNAGRSTQTLGSVYRYDALAPGEQFQGAVLTETMEQAQRIQALLQEEDYRLGGAQGGGYGKVTISDVRVDEDWMETPETPEAIRVGQKFRITLLSDAILRDGWGVTTTDLTCVLPFRVALMDSFRQCTYVGGFNRKWGLPLRQEQALTAGSVFVWRAEENISEGELQNFVEQGIGERRAEGFGRLAIDWGTAKEFTSPSVHRVYTTPKSTKLNNESERLARRMEMRLLRRNLDRELVRVVQETKVKGEIPNSQLSRLRIVARSALAEAKLGKKSLQRLVTLFDESNPQSLRRTALKKYGRVRISGRRLPEWIVELAQEPQKVWDILAPKQEGGGAPREAPWLPSPLRPGQEPVDYRSPELAAEYAVRLMDGVLEKKMKENR